MNTYTTTCPVCDEGSLSELKYSDEFKYQGRTIAVNDLEGCTCDVCGAEPILPEQIFNNQIKIADAKRRVINLLTGEEIKAIRKQLRLSQKRASEIFGGGANAFSKYERGEVIQSEAMDKLLRLSSKVPVAFSLLANDALGVSETIIAQYGLNHSATPTNKRASRRKYKKT